MGRPSPAVAYETNILTIIGNLTGDVTLQYTQGGVAVARLRVAVNEKRGDRETKCFWDVDAWRSLGEHVAASLKTGDRVIVIGRTVDDSYTRADGTEVRTKKIEADAVGPDLRFATASPTRTDTPAAFTPPAPESEPDDGDPF
ncbi:Single-stranded DNA-binding protein (plasmid) [Euzebya pacifica]|uniref:Single-stranded DNA-binding protein n=1 Tax=Euzebya pacifica TaxID=1608957 RepID=A0A346Y6N6_9ACTN|nr:single-stranded DNA-binding protein [Euzebya pacifica]AXV10133.1 Single-stranded DNA-binding protein [Euzebya pacifica]